MTRVAVIGLGRFGLACARRLYDQGADVLGIDRRQSVIEAAKNVVSSAVALDATVRENLEANDIEEMDAVVVAMADNFESSVLVTLHCVELGVPRVIAKAVNPLQNRVLHEIGAHQVVTPEEEMGERMANHILRESVVDFVELPDGYSLRRLKVPQDWFGRSLADLALLKNRRLNIVQIVRRLEPGEQGNDSREAHVQKIPLPHGETVVRPGDGIDVIGPDDVLDQLEPD